MPDNVRCIDCGLLGRIGAGESGILEVVEDWRTSDQWPHAFPVCVALKIRIRRECEAENPTVPRNAIYPKVTAIRNCDRFVAWEPGFSPKEHKEMGFQEEIRKEHAAQRERDRKFEEEIRQKDIDREKLTKRWDRGWAAGLAVVIAILTFSLGYFFGSDKGQRSEPNQSKPVPYALPQK